MLSLANVHTYSESLFLCYIQLHILRLDAWTQNNETKQIYVIAAFKLLYKVAHLGRQLQSTTVIAIVCPYFRFRSGVFHHSAFSPLCLDVITDMTKLTVTC